MEAVGIRWDKCIRIWCYLNVLAAVLVVPVLLHQHFLLRLIGIILLQMLGRERLAQ